MPGRYFNLSNLTLLLIALMTMLAGTSSSAQRREVGGGDAPLPPNTIVIDSIGDLLTTTRFKQQGSWGSPLDAHNSVGPAFTLTKETTLTEVGAYVESCYGISGGQYLERCEPVPSISVSIHPQLHDLPDVATVIASYKLSNDNDRTLISYESVKIALTLQPGTYYAIFHNPSNHGILFGGTSDPREFRCDSIPMAYVRKDPDSTNRSTEYLAVRILKKP